jgi:hypothetical protein
MKQKLKSFLIPMSALSAITIGAMPLISCSSALNQLVAKLKKHPEYQGTELQFNSYANVPSYTVHTHLDELVSQLRPVYTSEDQLDALIENKTDYSIKTETINGNTFIPAADNSEGSGTNYDAV